MANRVGILAIWLIASPVFAHGLHVTATADGKTIHGRVTYAGGDPVKNSPITARDAAEEVLAKTQTDDEGRFSLDAQWRSDYHLLAETADGHGGQFVVKAALLAADLPPRKNLPAIESPSSEPSHHHAADGTGDENPWTAEQIRAIQAKLDGLQEKLEAGERSIRLRDVFGGIGYILGVFGLYAIARNYREKNYRQTPQGRDSSSF